MDIIKFNTEASLAFVAALLFVTTSYTGRTNLSELWAPQALQLMWRSSSVGSNSFLTSVTFSVSA
jgi:hypothetical protein